MDSAERGTHGHGYRKPHGQVCSQARRRSQARLNQERRHACGQPRHPAARHNARTLIQLATAAPAKSESTRPQKTCNSKAASIGATSEGPNLPPFFPRHPHRTLRPALPRAYTTSQPRHPRYMCCTIGEVFCAEAAAAWCGAGCGAAGMVGTNLHSTVTLPTSRWEGRTTATRLRAGCLVLPIFRSCKKHA
jgi:hypothetical protein